MPAIILGVRMLFVSCDTCQYVFRSLALPIVYISCLALPDINVSGITCPHIHRCCEALPDVSIQLYIASRYACRSAFVGVMHIVIQVRGCRESTHYTRPNGLYEDLSLAPDTRHRLMMIHAFAATSPSLSQRTFLLGVEERYGVNVEDLTLGEGGEEGRLSGALAIKRALLGVLRLFCTAGAGAPLTKWRLTSPVGTCTGRCV